MELLFENDFINIFHDSFKQFLKGVWNEHATFDELGEDGFKETLLIWKRLAIENNIKYTLLDSVEFELPVTPELTNWVIQEINTPLKEQVGHKKQAHLMPKDFMANLGMEIFADVSCHNDLVADTQCFATLEEAEDWLFSK